MNRTDFKDHFSSDSVAYGKYRPDYPVELFAWLAELAPKPEIAWDCATGSGQAARQLCHHFALVLATDASRNQLSQARGPKNLHFMAAYAEAPPLISGCLDLITVAQALHWFASDRFSRESRRVLKAGGVFAAWTYNLLRIDAEVDRIIKRFYGEILGKYWPPERKLVEDGYRSLPFPFEEIHPPPFSMTATWTAGQLLGYLSTWSAVRRCQTATGKDPLDSIRTELLNAWGDPKRPRELHWPLSLRVGINRP